MNDKIEYKNIKINSESVSFERKEEGGKKRLLVKGYGAIFGNVDSYSDIIAKGAFTLSLSSKDKDRARLCWQHNIYAPIAKFTVLKEDDKGLYFEALISASEEEKAIKIEEGIIEEFSIGYRTMDAKYETVDGVDVRILTQLKLIEISAVTRAANDEAVIVSNERKNELLEQSVECLSDDELKSTMKKLEGECIKRSIIKLANKLN